MGDEQQISLYWMAYGDLAPLLRGMIGVRERHCQRIEKDAGRIREGDAVLS